MLFPGRKFFRHSYWLFFFTLPLTAQSYKVQHYTEDSGLSGRHVYSMARDTRGVMWFVCRANVVSYNGQRWQTYTFTEGLPTVNFRWVRADSKGQVWVSSRYAAGMLSTFKDGRWTNLPPMPWPKPDGFNFYYFEIAEIDGEPVPLIALKSGSVFGYRRGQWFRHGAEQGLTGTVNGLKVDGGTAYVATSQGLARYRDGVFDYSLNRALPSDRRNLLTLAFEYLPNSKRLWLVGPDWLGTLQDEEFTEQAGFEAFVQEHAHGELVAAADGQGGLYFGNKRRLYEYLPDRKRPRLLKRTAGLHSEGASDILIDEEGILWISGFEGVAKIASRRFESYSRFQGIYNDEVTAVMPWGKDKLLLGHNAGVSLLQGETIRHLPFEDIREKDLNAFSRVMDMVVDAQGNAWIAMDRIGVLRLEPSLDYRLFKIDSNKRPGYHALLVTRDGELWVGGNFGIARLKDGEWLPLDIGTLPKTHIRRFLQARNGDIYVSTNRKGVYRFDGDRWYRHNGWSDNENSTFGLYQDSKDQIWVGSLAGLLRIENNSLVPAKIGDRFIQRPIFLLFGENESRFWAGSDHGAFLIEDGKRFRHFTTEHGLAGLETNRDAGCVDQNGDVWIGTESGVSRYRERYDTRNVQAPKLYLSRLLVNGRYYSLDKPLKLAGDKNNLVFHFEAVSFRNERGVRFQSWLEGYEPSWSAPFISRDRQQRYTNLPPGTYRFHLKAEGDDGGWSRELVSPTIHINAPLLSRMWLQFLVLGVILAMAFVIYDYFSSKRNARNLEQKVEERTHRLRLEMENHRRAEARYQALSEELEERVRHRTAELEDLQKDLVENAHYSGMAEIATSVLHNVGNILNSVSISGYLIRESLDRSPMKGFLRANEILEEHADDLETFIREDPRAYRLLQYYLKLGERVRDQHEKVDEQTNLLLNKIQTIKDVVAQQHNYVSGVYQTETMPLYAMVEISLKILEENIVEKGIEVVRNFEEVPPVTIQRTKLIHTLVNLIKNAKESIIHSGSEQKRISLHIYSEGEQVLLTVEDTGDGISAENLNSIFNHGFTTKEMGQGFGLHSCANAMKEMGGRIWAESEGKGHGATFYLRFPPANGKPPGVLQEDLTPVSSAMNG